MGRFKIRSLGRSPRAERSDEVTNQEPVRRETTEDSWKLLDYPTTTSDSG
jgi:hypothetical protein